MNKKALTLELAKADAVIKWLGMAETTRAIQGPEYRRLIEQWRDESNARYLTYPKGA